MEYEQFDRRLARECAKAFSQSTGLGCTLSDKTGRAFDEYGYGCESCGMCAAAGASHDRCVQAHIYGMTEAERFGGKYIYGNTAQKSRRDTARSDIIRPWINR